MESYLTKVVYYDGRNRNDSVPCEKWRYSKDKAKLLFEQHVPFVDACQPERKRLKCRAENFVAEIY